MATDTPLAEILALAHRLSSSVDELKANVRGMRDETRALRSDMKSEFEGVRSEMALGTEPHA